jgi:hypothetical protein
MEEITPIFALQVGGPVKDATGLKDATTCHLPGIGRYRPNSRPGWRQWMLVAPGEGAILAAAEGATAPRADGASGSGKGA